MGRGHRRQLSGNRFSFAQGFSLAPVDQNQTPRVRTKDPWWVQIAPAASYTQAFCFPRLRVARAGVRSRATRHAWQA
jgi:hypothetical protein